MRLGWIWRLVGIETWVDMEACGCMEAWVDMEAWVYGGLVDMEACG